MKKKKLIIILLSTFLLTFSQQIVKAAETTQEGTKVSKVTGDYIESKLDKDPPVVQQKSGMRRAAARIPSSFPADREIFSTDYPAVRNQNPYGTCWAFSTLGLAEFDLINEGRASQNIDLSELQLAYFTYHFVTDPLGGTKGDSSYYYQTGTSETYLDYGGNYEMATRRLMQWIGAVKEENVPYSLASQTVRSGLNVKYAYGYNAAHLENAYIINIKKNASDVKRQIIEHGAVGVIYQHLSYRMAHSRKTGDDTYYDTSHAGGAHAVMIVGWDDNYSRDNFEQASKPSHNGAWLVRNSWGSESSYFWMSYETVSLMDAAWAMDFSDQDGYDNNYQLDGGLNADQCKEYLTMANVFQVQKKTGVNSENLKAVSVSMTQAANVSYTIDVYTNLQNAKDPTSGVRQVSARTTGKTSYAGIYTIPLEKEVKLAPGTSFAIVVKVDKAAIDYEVPSIFENYDSNQIIWVSDVSHANNQTFYNKNGKFYPWARGNACIKAYTANSQQLMEKHSISYQLNGGTNSKDNPAKYYRDSDALVLKNPVRKGYTFVGWYTDADCQTRITQIPTNSTRDYTLYAKWNPVRYKVQYQLNKGKNHRSNPATYSIESKTIVLKNPTRTGYTSQGWYSDAKFKHKVTKIAAKSTGNKTFYAKWQANRYVVRYHANGGKGKMSQTTVVYEVKTRLNVNRFQRAGYQWKGWNAYRQSDHKWYTTKGWKSAAEIKKGKYKKVLYKNKQAVAKTSSVNKDVVTMYAVWKKTKK